MSTAIEAASRILTGVFDIAILLDKAEAIYDYEGSASTIWRCWISHEQIGAVIPATVIVKRANDAGDGLLYEAAGLAFLDDVAPGVAPRLYGVDIDQRVVVMEDLSAPPDALMGNILFNADSEAAEAALLAFQRVLARVHLATMGHEGQFEMTCSRFGSPDEHSRHRIHTIAQTLDSLPQQLERIGIYMPASARDDIAEAAGMIRLPGMFAAFVHGDATPANVFINAGEIRIFDLETCGFRHALLDGSYARLRYLHSVWARRIPIGVQQRVQARYRDIFLAGCNVDGRTFDRHLTACCAGWLAGLCALLPGVIKDDRKWGRSTNRARIFAGLEHFARIAEETASFNALASICQDAVRRLRDTWPEADYTIQLYPAWA